MFTEVSQRVLKLEEQVCQVDVAQQAFVKAQKSFDITQNLLDATINSDVSDLSSKIVSTNEALTALKNGQAAKDEQQAEDWTELVNEFTQLMQVTIDAAQEDRKRELEDHRHVFNEHVNEVDVIVESLKKKDNDLSQEFTAFKIDTDIKSQVAALEEYIEKTIKDATAVEKKVIDQHVRLAAFSSSATFFQATSQLLVSAARDIAKDLQDQQTELEETFTERVKTILEGLSAVNSESIDVESLTHQR